MILKVARSVGLYILNEKRAYLQRLQQTHGLHVTVVVDDSLHAGDQEIERTELGERIAVVPPPMSRKTTILIPRPSRTRKKTTRSSTTKTRKTSSARTPTTTTPRPASRRATTTVATAVEPPWPP
ncbi:hypothetical protein ACRAWD_00110 [Caulobacter segnis]